MGPHVSRVTGSTGQSRVTRVTQRAGPVRRWLAHPVAGGVLVRPEVAAAHPHGTTVPVLVLGQDPVPVLDAAGPDDRNDAYLASSFGVGPLHCIVSIPTIPRSASPCTSLRPVRHPLTHTHTLTLTLVPALRSSLFRNTTTPRPALRQAQFPASRRQDHVPLTMLQLLQLLTSTHTAYVLILCTAHAPVPPGPGSLTPMPRLARVPTFRLVSHHPARVSCSGSFIHLVFYLALCCISRCVPATLVPTMLTLMLMLMLMFQLTLCSSHASSSSSLTFQLTPSPTL